MPEGDTIFRTAASLRRWLTGREVDAVRSAVPGFDGQRMVGRTIDAVDAVGKHLMIRLSGGLTLHTHMRMSGSWHVYPAGEAWRRPARQARVALRAGTRVAVCFNAPVVELLDEAGSRTHRTLRSLGPDVLAPGALDPAVVVARARARSANSPTVGEILLDQQVVAGIGNIYRCESLFLGGVDPHAPTSRVDDATLVGLVDTASRLMTVNATAPTGGTSRTFGEGAVAGAWVYRRRGQPCRRCATPIERGLLGAQARSVYWCPTCQPAAPFEVTDEPLPGA